VHALVHGWTSYHSFYHGSMKSDLRITIKDYRRGKNLKILLRRTPFVPGTVSESVSEGNVRLTEILTA
jgi:hypothetical protein